MRMRLLLLLLSSLSSMTSSWMISFPLPLLSRGTSSPSTRVLLPVLGVLLGDSRRDWGALKRES